MQKFAGTPSTMALLQNDKKHICNPGGCNLQSTFALPAFANIDSRNTYHHDLSLNDCRHIRNCGLEETLSLRQHPWRIWHQESTAWVQHQNADTLRKVIWGAPLCICSPILHTSFPSSSSLVGWGGWSTAARLYMLLSLLLLLLAVMQRLCWLVWLTFSPHCFQVFFLKPSYSTHGGLTSFRAVLN